MTTKDKSLVQAMLDRSVVLGIGLMIALLGIGAVGNYRNVQTVQRNATLVAHTHDVDRLAAELLRLVTEAVAKQRGYLISHNEATRKAARFSLDQALVRYEDLLQNTLDNPEQQRRLNELKQSLDGFQKTLIEGMELRSNGVSSDELSLEATAITGQLDHLRNEVLAFRAEESRLLQDREDDVSAALRTALISGVITFALGLALFMGIIELIRRNASIQQRQQQQLAAETEHLAVTLASIDDAVISVDRQGHVTHWSDHAERLTDQLRESVVGRHLGNVLQLVDEFSGQTVAVPLEHVIQGASGGGMDSPCLVLALDGRTAPVSVRISPICDQARRVNGAVVVLRELSEERRAETAKSERARILSLRADIGMILSRASQTGEPLQQCVNSIGEQLSAVAVSAWILDSHEREFQRSATYCLPEWEFAPAAASCLDDVTLRAAIEKHEIIRCPATADTGEIRWLGAVTGRPEVSLWVCPLTFEDRRLGVLSVYTRKPLSDLSSSELALAGFKLSQFIERRAIEEARQESEELFRTLANSIPQLAWMARPDGYIFWYNQRWYDYTGTTLQQMQGWGWQAVHDPNELPRVLESIRYSFATGTPWRETFPLRRHDGEFRWHLSQMLPVRDEHGRTRLWFGTNTDVTEQRNAEQRLRRVIDSMFAFVAILSDDGTLIEINQAPLIASGLAREEVIGLKFWDCPWWTHDETVSQRMRESFERSLRGELVRYDEQIRLKGSESYTIDFMLQPVFDNGKLLFVIPSGVDVTARKQAEDRLSASEEFLRSVLDALASHIAVLDENGVILMVNRAWREFADHNGLDSSSYSVGENFLRVASPVTADCDTEAREAANGIRTVLEGTQPWFVMEYPCHSPTQKRWFLMRVDRLTSSESIRVVVSHEDISSRVLSEEATRRWSAQQQRLAEIAVEISGAKALRETLEIVNIGARKLIESAAAETIRVSDDGSAGFVRSIAVKEEDQTAEGAAVGEQADWIRQRVCDTNRPLRITAAIPPTVSSEANLSEITPIALNSLAVPLTNQVGKNIGLIHLQGKMAGEFTADDEAILVQLAQMASVALERARLYEEIKAADGRKDEFLATLAHELRNPLSAISAATQLTLMQPDNATQVRSTSQLAARQCLHLKKLVDDLLDVSRISRGKLNLQLEPIRLQDVIQHALETARATVEASQHELTTHITSDPLYVRGDTVRLAQVVSNLLVNAAKYTANGGKITLELNHDGTTGVISVCDNGIGIPHGMMDRIFEIFAQVDSSHTRSQGGLGIGLTLAKTLVDMHGGTIGVVSEGENRGSTFTVRLPLATLSTNDMENLTRAADKSPAFTSRRILVVDDNRAAVHLLGRLLSMLGHSVKTACDGRTALTALIEHHPEIVISDIGMPDMSGYELAEQIRRTPNISTPVLVALTGYGQETDRQAAYEAGFSHHLTKPVSLTDLEQLMQTLSRKG